MLYKLHNSDMELFLKYPKKLFSSMGCWPYANTKFFFIIELQRIISHLISYIFTFSLVINLYFSLDDLATAADAVYLCSANATYLIKVTLFAIKRNKFEELIQDLENPLFITTDANQEKIIEKWIQRAYFYCKLFSFSVVGYVSLFGLFPLFDEEAFLPAQGWFPFDVRKNKINYSIAYLFQLLGLGVCATINVSLDLLPSVFMNIGCAQLEILKFNLEHAVDNANEVTGNMEIEDVEENCRKVEDVELLSKEAEEVLVKTLVNCVERHNATIKLFNKIQSLFNPGMFMQFLSCAMTLCVTGLQLVVLPVASMKFLCIVFYFVVIVVEVSLYCFNGDYVLLESSTVSNSCYEMQWYQCSIKVRRMLIIIMERAKRPNIITAGLFNISLITLTFILRTSYSYFTVLHRMYTDD